VYPAKGEADDHRCHDDVGPGNKIEQSEPIRLPEKSSQPNVPAEEPAAIPGGLASRNSANRRACDQCGKLFMPRQHTGGSVQRFCCNRCRLDWHKQRQRIQRIGVYAGQPTVPATPQAVSSETPPSEPAVRRLHAWETGVLDIAGCDRTEFVVALNHGDATGVRVETWPPEVRAFMDQHLSRWIEENEKTRTVHAMTVAAPRHHGLQSCVVILHHFPRK
jgi:hypothetical protein